MTWKGLAAGVIAGAVVIVGAPAHAAASGPVVATGKDLVRGAEADGVRTVPGRPTTRNALLTRATRSS